MRLREEPESSAKLRLALPGGEHRMREILTTAARYRRSSMSRTHVLLD